MGLFSRKKKQEKPKMTLDEAKVKLKQDLVEMANVVTAKETKKEVLDEYVPFLQRQINWMGRNPAVLEKMKGVHSDLVQALQALDNLIHTMPGDVLKPNYLKDPPKKHFEKLRGRLLSAIQHL